MSEADAEDLAVTIAASILYAQPATGRIVTDCVVMARQMYHDQVRMREEAAALRAKATPTTCDQMLTVTIPGSKKTTIARCAREPNHTGPHAVERLTNEGVRS